MHKTIYICKNKKTVYLFTQVQLKMQCTEYKFVMIGLSASDIERKQSEHGHTDTELSKYA